MAIKQDRASDKFKHFKQTTIAIIKNTNGSTNAINTAFIPSFVLMLTFTLSPIL